MQTDAADQTQIQILAKALEGRITRLRPLVSQAEILRRAGVAQSTWCRWKAGTNGAQLRLLSRVEAAIAAEERRQAENQHGGTSDTGDGPGQALIPDACRLSAGTGSAE